jgi:oxygen-independent coproporphyrinogen-3 oxidase
MVEFLYIHIPFCLKKCLYCDFLSVPYDEPFVKRYIDALCKELKLKNHLTKTLHTIYIGGGTPSLLPEECFQQLFACLKDNYRLSSSIEITVEVNPGTINESKINTMLSLGVNRISIGIQSFNDRELQTLGRIHDSVDAVKSIELIKKAGIINYSIDLIYGIPGQTMDSWKESLSKAVAFSPAHISAYELTLEENTPLYKMIKSGNPPSPLPSPARGEGYIFSSPLRGGDEGEGEVYGFINDRISKYPPLAKEGKGGFPDKLKMPDEDIILDMYNYAINYLASFGHEHYEISNFAVSGYQCMHNLNYWDRGEYIGAGAGAHSFIGNLRSENTGDVHHYTEDLREGKIPEANSIQLIPNESLKELIFLGLRKREGIDISKLKVSQSGLLHKCKELFEEGYMDIKEGHLRLTRKGISISNIIIVKLFESLGF